MASLTYQPQQRLSIAEKDDDWAKQNIDFATNLITVDNLGIRETQYNKRINIDLWNGIINESDIEKIYSPLQIKGYSFPEYTQNYPIEIPKFNLLLGDELRRDFYVITSVISENVISDKQIKKRNEILNIFNKIVQGGGDQAVNKKYLENIIRYYNYDYKDMRELMVSRIIDYLMKTINTRSIFNNGFLDVLLNAEEIYNVDIISGEPGLRKLNPENVYCVGSGSTSHFEDMEIIVIESYRSISQITDDYYEELTDADYETLEKYKVFKSGVVNIGSSSTNAQDQIQEPGDASVQSITTSGSLYYGGEVDINGNIKECKVYWKSKRQMGILKWIDEEGEEQQKWIDENYSINKSKGESVDWVWVDEWYEATKVGSIYLKMRPWPVNRYGMDDLRLRNSPIVGTIYNYNSRRAVSLMDRIKPYKYDYNNIRRKLDILLSRNIGPVLELSLAHLPDGWDFDKFFYFFKEHNIAVKDDFAEGKRGYSKGKIIGGIAQGSHKVLNMSVMSELNQYVNLLNNIKRDIDDITGIPKQREGDIAEREAVRNVQFLSKQSALITEKYFTDHDDCKLRVIRNLVECAKETWKGKTKKLNYIDDGLRNVIFEVDGNEFNEIEYDIHIGSDIEERAQKQMLIETSNMAMASGHLSRLDYITINTSKSLSEIRKTIEKSETERAERENQLQTAQINAGEKESERKYKIEQEKLLQERELAFAEIDIRLLEIEMRGSNDRDKKLIEEKRIELQNKKINLESQLSKQKIDSLSEKSEKP